MERYLFNRQTEVPLTDAELVDKALEHIRNAQNAMSQTARTGNLDLASRFEQELARRAEASGDNSGLELFNTKIEEMFGGEEK